MKKKSLLKSAFIFLIFNCAFSYALDFPFVINKAPVLPDVMGYVNQGAPAFGDIDGDGEGEIVVGTALGSSVGAIYAFEKNGSNVTGFPVTHGYTTRTIVLGDIDNNGTMEIITNKRLSSAGEVYVYKGDGTVYSGWPKSIDHVPASSCAVGDITGDGLAEIIAESYTSLYAWDRNGNLLSGFPFVQPANDVNSYSAPVLVDLTGDNIREIVWGSHILGGGGNVYILKNDGSILSGWPKPVNWWIYGPPSVGFINNDNVLDIAVGDQVLSASPVDYVYGWIKNGTPLAGFPIGPINAVNTQILLGDIDNDNMTELIFDDNTSIGGLGKYLAYNHDGTPVNGWPITTQGTSFFYTPMLFDVNRNGILDISGGSNLTTSSSTIYLWNTGMNYNPSRIYVRMWQYNPRHNGVFGDTNIVVSITRISSNVPEEFNLYQNYPNPFNPSAKIRFDVPNNRNVTLKIYNSLGKEVNILINQSLSSGTYETFWNAQNQPSGVYFYKLTAGDYSVTKKMILVK
ncbi:MAG: T9SS type A sorting domain-containing protein [Chlorobi bacterium]|nr:T9SS type A sorting domain-containing protein [Chlorobiota bacterium]MCI0715971.1 T9SS type A sorting domain-containing protein [Chlorobiota bacterium]